MSSKDCQSKYLLSLERELENIYDLLFKYVNLCEKQSKMNDHLVDLLEKFSKFDINNIKYVDAPKTKTNQ